MGCDGGSIPSRRELVKEKERKKTAQEVDPNQVAFLKWFTCAITGHPLEEPVSTCALGFLYNKEAVVRALLSKSIPDNFSHIKSLKDIITLNMTRNPDWKVGTHKSDLSGPSPWICPITSLEIDGSHHFSAIKTCGCVLSARALREVQSEICLKCGKPFKSDDVVPLNPSDEELQALKEKIPQRTTKSKKRERVPEKTDPPKTTSLSTTPTTTTTQSRTTSTTTKPASPPTEVKSGPTKVSSTQKILREEPEEKKRKLRA